MINIKETKREFIAELLKKDIHKVLDLGCGEMLLPKAFLKKGALVKGIGYIHYKYIKILF